MHGQQNVKNLEQDNVGLTVFVGGKQCDEPCAELMWERQGSCVAHSIK